ncbi:MAG: imelysin family protein [Pseudomonadota bacterium]
MRAATLCLLLLIPNAVFGQSKEQIVRDVVSGHILPGFERLAAETTELNALAADDCDPASSDLRAAYGEAFDAWLGVGHLRFGPSETDNRAFGLAFWPDTRGATPKALAGLVSSADPIVDDPDAFATESIAARGFYAMEFLLNDPQFTGSEDKAYRCRLIRAVAVDIDRTADAILSDWQSSHAEAMQSPSADGPYRDTDEALRAIYTALATGLQVTSEARLGRPLGTFDRPRPNRAEVRRSGRSLHHVVLSLEAVRDLAARLATLTPEGADVIDGAFERAFAQADRVDDPVFASVADPMGRLRVEVLQQRVNEIREATAEIIAPTLGVAAGFNSLDGD